jgi:hypothetical protein
MPKNKQFANHQISPKTVARILFTDKKEKPKLYFNFAVIGTRSQPINTRFLTFRYTRYEKDSDK